MSQLFLDGPLTWWREADRRVGGRCGRRRLGPDAGHRVGLGRPGPAARPSGDVSPDTGGSFARTRASRPGFCSSIALGHLRLLGSSPAPVIRELAGPGALRFLVHVDDGRRLRRSATWARNTRSCCRPRNSTWSVGPHVFPRPHLRRTPTLPVRPRDDRVSIRSRDRIFLSPRAIAAGSTEILEASADDDGRGGRPDSPSRGASCGKRIPDVIENHNLHGFDLPFLVRRARLRGVPLALGRLPGGLRQRAARRGIAAEDVNGPQHVRFVAPGPRADRHDGRGHALRIFDRRSALAGPQGGRAPLRRCSGPTGS